MSTRRGSRSAGTIALAVFAAAALLAPLSANAATITNGDFNNGNLVGWQTQLAGTGNWFVYAGTSSPQSAHVIPAPPQGTYAAISDQTGASSAILYQDIALEPGYSQKLSLIAYYTSSAAIFVPNPDSLDSTVPGNQQYRIDVMKPSAPVNSVNPADILLTVFRTNTGAPLALGPTPMTADLTPFAGQTVRLRFAQVDVVSFLNAGVDAVSLVSTPPVNTFSFGKVKRNENNGTATLTVNVPGAGKLALTGKGIKTQRAAGRAVASKNVAAAGKVKLLVKAKGKAKSKLAKTGKAKVKAKITFTPTFGTAKSSTKRVKLVKSQ
jgi:hypothetical protein